MPVEVTRRVEFFRFINYNNILGKVNDLLK